MPGIAPLSTVLNCAPRPLPPTPWCRFVMIQQQKAGRSLPAEFRHIVSTYGMLKPMKGLSATIMRESLYASGYLAVAPMLRGVLQQQPAVANLPGGPLILSGIAAGLLATVCTQPADTIKTRMQASPLCLLLLLVWLACRICLLHAWLKWQVPSLSRMRLRGGSTVIDALLPPLPCLFLSPLRPFGAGIPRCRHAPRVPLAAVHHPAHCAHRGGGHTVCGAGTALHPHRCSRQVWGWPAMAAPWSERGAGATLLKALEGAAPTRMGVISLVPAPPCCSVHPKRHAHNHSGCSAAAPYSGTSLVLTAAGGNGGALRITFHS